ncbi:hypothetical protein FOZ63_004878 [Perkinsus olseni]|uniref:Uncharacterized protein n=2 Tax=Perkinsus olseni TaxID=32597 RepID=A0A7J6PA76_PEROL|nr:hypothetical protein FOZ63_004878 [Perkinsus olseni]
MLLRSSSESSVDRHPSNPAAEGFIKVDTEEGGENEESSAEGMQQRGQVAAEAVAAISGLATDFGDGPMTLNILLSSGAGSAFLAALVNLLHVLYYHPLALLSVAESLFLASFSVMMLAVDLPTHNRVAMELRGAGSRDSFRQKWVPLPRALNQHEETAREAFDEKTIELIINMMVEDGFPLSMVEKAGFRALLYHIPSANESEYVTFGFTEGFLKILTRITGKGAWYGYLGSAVFSSMRSNNCWAAGAWLLGGYTFLVGLIAGALGFSKSRKLNRIRREVGLQFDNDAERVYESFAVDDPSRGMTREEFAAMACNN